MARRTTVVLRREDEQALRDASRAEGVSQSELIRRGIALVTGPHRRRRKPTVGWLKLTRSERAALRRDEFGDPDS
jgi:hypothetical protein